MDLYVLEDIPETARNIVRQDIVNRNINTTESILQIKTHYISEEQLLDAYRQHVTYIFAKLSPGKYYMLLEKYEVFIYFVDNLIRRTYKSGTTSTSGLTDTCP